MSVDPTSSPLAYFGAELRRLRDKASMTQATLAQATSYSVPAVSAFETARRIPSAEFALMADRELDADGGLIRLQALVEKTSVLPWFRDRVEVEREAIEIREYEPYQIPGLLQTENYTRIVIEAARPVLSADDVERAIALRMTRQQILADDENVPIDKEPTPRLWVVMEQAALSRIVGNKKVMEDQLDFLIGAVRRPNLTIQIIPFSRGVTCAFGRAFTILTSVSGAPVVYLEDVRSARYIRDRDEAGRYVVTFDHLRASALDDTESLHLIKECRNDIGNHLA